MAFSIVSDMQIKTIDFQDAIMDSDTKFAEHLKVTTIAFGDEPLLVLHDGQIINLAKGYIPQHVNFTVEDKAAKGLRKGKAGDKVEPPVYFSALDVVCDNQILLLTGPSGSGKTTFAKHLAFNLVTEPGTSRLIDTIPYYSQIDSSGAFGTLLNNNIPMLAQSITATNSNLIIILDTIEKLEVQGPRLLSTLLAIIKPLSKVRLLLLGDSSIIRQWFLPSEIIRHDLRSLSEDQRRDTISSLTGTSPSEVKAGLGAAAETPAYLALALQANYPGDNAEELLDAWLEVVAPGKDASEGLAATAFASCDSMPDFKSLPVSSPALTCNAVQQLLAARHLANQPLNVAIDLFHQNPVNTEPVIRSLLARLDRDSRQGLLQGLLQGTQAQTQRGALVVADFVPDFGRFREQVSDQMVTIIEGGTLPIVHREKAGRVLSRLRDPRDLEALASIPAGEFLFGSKDHPNSQPVAPVRLSSFLIGLYPVVNKDYSVFVRETGRDWRSPDGFDPETQNAPATDLTWHDGTAYCEWLTVRWQSSGKISHEEKVRLPSELEWERAARGDQQSDGTDGETIYPWGTEWKHDAINYEESGFNSRIPVGLFPAGCSQYGCYDMVGQVWEWCTTLWGEDMTTPSFRYPWRADGREDLDAPGSVRRVLRGGCFSSGRLKASCTYRGSLEPAGFWRGNGFRVVVAPVRP